jgi:hypothetical protein
MSFSRISNLQCPKEYVYKNEPVAERFLMRPSPCLTGLTRLFFEEYNRFQDDETLEGAIQLLKNLLSGFCERPRREP